MTVVFSSLNSSHPPWPMCLGFVIELLTSLPCLLFICFKIVFGLVRPLSLFRISSPKTVASINLQCN
ncbi:unnamed protein product [Prunus brigantina]